MAKTAVALNQDLKALIPYEGVDAEFLAWALRRYSQDILARCSKHGTTVHSIETPRLQQFKIPLAPTNEQRRIVDKIDELFSQVEAGEEALERAQRLLERYRQSILNAAVNGELTRDWREQHEDELESGEVVLKRILRARREAWEQAEFAKMLARGMQPKDSRWKDKYLDAALPDLADPPEVPYGWQLVSCDALTYHITSGSRAWRKFYDRGSSTFIMAQNVRPGRYDPTYRQLIAPPLNDPETERTRAQRGDLLVTIVGANTGDVCTFDYDVEDHYVCQSVALLRPWDEVYGRYLGLYFQAEDAGQRQYKRYIYGAGRPHLSFAQLRQTVIALPPEQEAAEIVARVDETLSEVDTIASELMHQRKFVSALRQSILSAAFSGKLVQQDPANEAASMVLERIREERKVLPDDGGLKRSRNRRPPSHKSEFAMVKTRKEVKPTHLRDIIRSSNGGMAAEALWDASKLDIDDFYKQLRAEIAAGHLREERDGHTSRIVCR